MPFEHVNRREVERRKERLLAEYDESRVVETTFDVEQEEFAETVAHARDGYIGGGYCWVVRSPAQAAPLTESMPEKAGNDHDRALLIMSRGADRWGVPGGGLEGYDPAVEGRPLSPSDAGHGETYEEAARREVEEETGVACTINDCFRLEHARWVPTDHRKTVMHALYTFFDATYAGGHIRVQPGELDGAAWFRQIPERLHPATEGKAERWVSDRPRE